MIVSESNGHMVREVGRRRIEELPEGDLLINVKYSSLNYKDAMSATGNRGVTKRYPHTPGIDAAGVVVTSENGDFARGDEVVVTGYDLGMNTPGGFGRYIRVPADWVVKKPQGLTLRECMTYGTAGFTAGLSLYKLEAAGVTPDDGDILVTGASGGVGSMAVAILAKAGYRVCAATGKSEQHEFLKRLGAAEILSRKEVDDKSKRPLLPQRWAGVVDVVGGNILTAAIKSTKRNGSVTTCGLTQSADLNTTVYPFILRGVNLLGINSADTRMPVRRQIWQNLAGDWRPEMLAEIGTDRSLEELDSEIEEILNGRVSGRIVVDLDR
ncbi:acryloyl-CoA reductase [candidate division GN15 bacterium]|nr:acryloyl-CoA reductase [candidate division GN15 bacterium]